METIKRYKWWHGLAFYSGVLAVQWGMRRAVSAGRPPKIKIDDRTFYRTQRLPVFAPPPGAFPIAWTINSTCSTTGLLHAANQNSNTRGRRQFFGLQAVAWALFAAFNTAYFELRSPINAALITVAYAGVTAASMRAAVKMNDRFAVASLIPTAAWLTLAVPVAIAQAAWNRDEFWRLEPLLTAPERWAK
jgi:translocator protein